MAGRPLCSDEEAVLRGFSDPAAAHRRQVLRETLAAIEGADPPDRFHQLAQENLERWRVQSVTCRADLQVMVFADDWGEVTRLLTRKYGRCFAVLNMANAFVPGGAYVEGAVAQEENMYRRTDCHFRISPDQYDHVADRYHPAMTRVLSAEDTFVYLDVKQPRVCLRGPEDRSKSDLGYHWLSENQVFPFFELRAAAQDLRDGSEFDPDEARRRISVQLDTLRHYGIRYVVLGAFGCGAFRNPARAVATIYREEINIRAAHFDVIAFAIFSSGYGRDNYTPFAEVFSVRKRR